MAVTKQAARALSMYRHADRVLADHVRGAPIACRSGCSWCCYFDVDVTPAEAEAIVGVLKTLHPRDRRARIEALKHAQAARQGLDGPMDRYFARIPCALLVDGKCSVHAVRPLLCRGYLSRDKAECQRGFEERTDSEVIASAMNIASILQTQLDLRQGKLEDMVLAALEGRGTWT